MPAVSLEVSHLYKQFQTDQGDVHAVEDVSFEVLSGSFFTLLGPSGCGKSTTLRCIAGLEKPDSGMIRLEGAVFVSSTEGIWVPERSFPSVSVERDRRQSCCQAMKPFCRSL